MSKSQIITTFGGTTSGYSGDGGTATSAKMNHPSHCVFDKYGNFYVNDYYNHVVRKINPSGIITTVAGRGTSGYSGDGGAATLAKLNSPNGLTIDTAGNLFIADERNFVVRKVSTTGIITTVAGNGSSGFSGDGGAATAAKLYTPVGVNADTSGNIFICDHYNNRVRKVNSAGVISTVAGSGAHTYTGDGGQATAAGISQPTQTTLDAAGNLYIVDQFNQCVRKVDMTTGIISTIGGTGSAGFSGDGGPATAAMMFYPSEAKFNSAGDLFIADAYNYNIRKINSSGVITTVAGNNTPGYSGDGGAATAANLNQTWGIAFDNCDNLYICDAMNEVVRKVAFFTSMPHSTGSSTLRVGSTTVIRNSLSGGTWSSLLTSIATVNATTGVVTGVANGTTKIIYTTVCGIDSFTMVIGKEQTSIVETVQNSSNLQISPNPSNGSFTITGNINVNGAQGNTQLYIYDMLGKRVYATAVSIVNGNINQNVDLSQTLAPGHYILKLTGGNVNQVLRIEIQN